MTSYVFSKTVTDDISSEKQRISVNGGREGVVNYKKYSSAFERFSNLADVKTLKSWVGGSF